MAKYLSRQETVRQLTRYEKWRKGEIDSYSSTKRVPAAKTITKIMESAIYHLTKVY